jgi:hypothetical protein
VTHYIACPRAKCEGEIEWTIESDSDDSRSWLEGVRSSDTCSEGCDLTEEELAAADDLITSSVGDAAVADAEAIVEASVRAAEYRL